MSRGINECLLLVTSALEQTLMLPTPVGFRGKNGPTYPPMPPPLTRVAPSRKRYVVNGQMAKVSNKCMTPPSSPSPVVASLTFKTSPLGGLLVWSFDILFAAKHVKSSLTPRLEVSCWDHGASLVYSNPPVLSRPVHRSLYIPGRMLGNC